MFKFPCLAISGPPYANDDALLDTLVVLGMTERVALDTLVVVASDISSKYLELRDMPNADDDISALVLRSRRLLTLLDEAASSHKESSDISTWSKLLSLSFCPVLQAPPHSGCYIFICSISNSPLDPI